MSHSRILVLNNAEFDVDEMFEEMQSYGNDVDYIDDSIELKQEDFDWFMNYVKNMGFTKGSEDMSFKVESVEDFWQSMTKDIQRILEDDGGVNGMNRFELEDRLNIKRGFWIFIDGELYTLPYFIRCYGKVKYEFTVTAILDCHM